MARRRAKGRADDAVQCDSCPINNACLKIDPTAVDLGVLSGDMCAQPGEVSSSSMVMGIVLEPMSTR